MSYDTELEELFRKAPEGTGRAQAIRIDFNGAASNLFFIKGHEDKILYPEAVGGSLTTFIAASFQVDQPQVNDQQQQVLNITFPSAGTEMYERLEFIRNNELFIEISVTYYEYYINGFVTEVRPGYVLGGLNALSVGVDAKANVQIQCSTDNLNTYRVGDIYTYDEFPFLRNL